MPPRPALRLTLSAGLAALSLLGLSASAQTPEIGATPARPPLTAAAPRTANPYSQFYTQARRTAGVNVTSAAGLKATVLSPPAGPTVDTVKLQAYVDGVVDATMTDDHLAGAAVVVVQNGQIVLSKGYGIDRISPRRAVDPDRTLFRIGSISETFTWIALQREIGSGRMRLNAPVNLYLPERLQLKDQGFKTPVRLRDLMTHTGGFEDRALGQLYERDWQRVRPLTLYLRQEQPRRVREPGQMVSYSNYGAGLAGAAVANVQGKSFERLIEEEILIPTGMANTTFREPHPNRSDLPQAMTPGMAANVSQGFGWQNGQFAPRAFEYIGQIAPAGSASATPADMGRYMSLLLAGGTLDGRTVYSPAVDRAIRTPLYRPAQEAAGWTAGFEDLPLPGGRRGLGHDGQTLSFRSNMVLIPSLNLGVFVVANSEGGAHLTQTLAPALVRQMFGPPVGPPPAAQTPPGAPQVYPGKYLTNRRAYAGLEAFVDRLFGRATVSAQPDGTLVVDMDGQKHAYLPAPRSGLFRDAEGGAPPVVFGFDVRGRAKTLFAPTGGDTFQRQGLLDSLGLMTTLAIATGICALAVIGGLFAPLGQLMRQTMVQSRTALSQALQSLLWLIALICFAIWVLRSGDRLRLSYDWPGPLIITASACALVAGVLGVLDLLLAPLVWKGGRRLDSWTLGRKLRFTCTALIFTAFTGLIGLWGGLTPWVS